ncbi:MAG: inorganic phosphate transporter [Bacteroidia bacterium]|nr:MAG: inorganic phosphate transporter [Bacteroidia bacterium]
MEAYYILIVGVLFLLAISILIVGVSNDAVNFLNSAIGAKAAPFKVILTIAGIWVLVGAIFSNGMMEVARKGIFNPEYFAFSEIMVIFLAVMLTNILLLDFFNTIGLPTSTTVSVVFGILGAAVAVSIYKITREVNTLDTVGTFINVESSVLIVVGIFLSVVIAFNAGMIIQWVVRLAFSFNVKKTSKYWTGIWGGFAITSILYFLLIKGAKGSTLVTTEMLAYIKSHTTQILLISFTGWTILFQILVSFTRVNILKIIVLVGTFALAMAFAGNDLVNFIGVPLAGFESFKAFMASGASDASGFLMIALQESVKTPLYFLVAAGLIMVLTLRFSKKAKSVTATTIDLSRQDEGSERFDSSILARFIIRQSVEISNGIHKITPHAITRFVEGRFDAEIDRDDKEEKLAFDLVRASVNLVVASILIALGTSFRLPLSTTYVTFMVAMGTSLADGAWGRESAVFRISGVLTVVGGWFFTAFIAFLASFLIASLIFFGKLPVILILLGLSVFILLRTHAFHKLRVEKQERLDNEITTASHEVLKTCDDEVMSSIIKVSKILFLTYTNLFKEKHKELKKLSKEVKHLSRDIKEIRANIPNTLKKFKESEMESGHHYAHVVTYMKEMSYSLMHIVQPAFNHLDNKHPLDKEQIETLKDFNVKVGEFFNFVIILLKNKNSDNLNELTSRRDELINMANDIFRSRIKILKKTHKGGKESVTYMEMLVETKNLLLQVVQLVKADIHLHESYTSTEEMVKEEVLD